MTKYCPKCEKNLSVDLFNKSNRRDGYQTYCRSCHNYMQRQKYNNDPEQKLKRQVRERKRKSLNPLAKKDSELKRIYGISINDYLNMFEKQNMVCKICKQECKTKLSLSVDHDHATGKIRGLLCNRCNRAIGMFEDSPELLKMAARYLENKDI
jgi:uncharacterized protein YbaR (Trm112 family)